jgi:hypothetical protein
MMMSQVQEQMSSQISAMDPATLMKTWMPVAAKAWENFPEQFFAQSSRDAGNNDDD